MHTLALILGIVGFAAVASRLARTLLLLLQGGVAALVAGEVGRTRAQHGDLTGMQDAAEQRAVAVRRRRGALAGLAFWVGLLVLPPLTPWPPLVFASYSVLWLLPHRRREA